ncbi:MAG: POTRA domain-containing protein [Planctomycetota bacterium]
MPLVESPRAACLRTLFGVWAAVCLAVCRAPSQEVLPAPQPSAAEAVEGEVVDPANRVAKVMIVGNDTIPEVKIAGHLNTREGREFDPSIINRDVRQLDNLGWFVDIKTLEQQTPAGRVVIFQVKERPTIRYVQFLGNKDVPDKKLRKETGLLAGGAIEPYAVEDAARKIKEYYEGRGYNNVQVTIDEGGKPTDKGVTFIINEGKSERVWSVDFVGNTFASDGRLKTLIKSKPPILKLWKGYISAETLDADVEKLTAYYRSFGFFQARVGRRLKYNDEGNWADLTYVIHEGPRSKIRNVRFLGNTKFEPVAMAETAKLQADQFFEQAKMLQDANWLQELYGSHGYVFADVRPETIYLEEPGQVDLVYHIEEGEQWRVGRIIVNIAGDNPHTRRQVALNRLDLVPGEIMDIRKLRASERRLAASSLFHVDPATGVRPKITYRISDEASVASRPKKSGSGGGFRGQSPDNPGPPVLLPPGWVPPSLRSAPDVEIEFQDEAHFERWLKSQRSKSSTSLGPNRETEPRSEFHSAGTPTVVRGQSPEEQPQQPAWQSVPRQPVQQQLTPQQPATQQPTGNPYGQLRGQSPAAVNPAYAGLNTQPAQYGGTVVRPTGPSTKPTAIADPNVQPVQFAPELPPPAGQFGPTPGFSANSVPGYQTFPSGQFGLPGQPYPDTDQTVDIIFNGQETQTGRLMLGLGVNSDAGVVGNIVIDERNFDWRRPPTSFEDFRNGTAWRGDGQRFRIDASPGSEVNRYLVSFSQPYLFDSPISLSLSGSYFDRRFNNYDEQRLGGRIALGYQWLERDLSTSVSYRGENVNVSDLTTLPGQVADLDEVLGDNQLHEFGLTGVNDTRDSAFLPTEGHYLQLRGAYTTGKFEYERVEGEYRQYFLLRERPDHSGRHVLSFATNVGYLGDQAPIYDRYFAGGFSTMRGYDFRGASPAFFLGGQRIELGGTFQWINSAQYLFPITADETLHGVAFVDFGTVEPEVQIEDFRVAPGVGLRITVPALGPAPIALDFAWSVAEAAFDERDVFSFSLGFSR